MRLQRKDFSHRMYLRWRISAESVQCRTLHHKMPTRLQAIVGSVGLKHRAAVIISKKLAAFEY